MTRKHVILCPACQADYQVLPELLGRDAICRQCGSQFTLALRGATDTQTFLARPVAETGTGSEIEEYDTQHFSVLADSIPVAMPIRDDNSFGILANSNTEVRSNDIPDQITSLTPKLAGRTDHACRADDSGDPDSNGPVPDEWQVGDLLLDVYEVRPLADNMSHAEGGMGLVHRVYHRDWHMDLAVKSPNRATMRSEHGKSSFERECQTWIELGMHPNIVTCYLVRRMDGTPRVFAEFVEDGCLRDWVRDRRLYADGPDAALRRILDIAIQLAWGLQHAHRQGVIHLDVKPANVMMQGSVAKVTDFGLARAQMTVIGDPPNGAPGANIATSANTAASANTANSESGKSSSPDSGVSWEGMTPAYCSPEQRAASLQHHQKVPTSEQILLTRATDIWSWALSVLTMFHGRPPCRKGGHTAAQVFGVYLKQQEREAYLPKISDGVAELLVECFQADPSDRPGSMAEIADRLVQVYTDVTGGDYPRQKPVDTELTADSLNNRAASMLDLGKRREARRFLHEAWQLRPWHPRVTYNRAMLEWRCGLATDLDTLAQLQELCKTHAEDPESHFAMALARNERADYGSAIDSLHQAVALAEKWDNGGPVLEELHKVIDETMPLSEHPAKCAMSFNTYAPEPDSSGSMQHARLLVSHDEDAILTYDDPTTLVLRAGVSGRTFQTFHRSDDAKKSSYLSADLNWELRQDAGMPDHLLLHQTSTGKPLKRFRPIHWGHRKKAQSDDHCMIAEVGPEPDLVKVRLIGERREIHRTLRGHSGPVSAISATSDGRWVMTGGSDMTLRLWDSTTGQCVRTFRGHNNLIEAVYIATDGRWAVSLSGQHGLRLWDVAPISSTERSRPSPVLLCHVTSSEETARTQNECLELLERAQKESEAGRIAESLELVRRSRELPGFETMSKRFSTWEMAGQYSVHSEPLDALCLKTLTSESGQVRAARLSSDANWIISGGWNGTLELWNVESGCRVREYSGHRDWIRDIAIVPNVGTVITGSWDTTLRLWNISTGETIRTFAGHKKQVETIDVDPTGQMVASAGWDGSVRLWRISDGECLRTFERHDGYVSGVAISPDVQQLASVDENGLLKIWSLATGKCVREITPGGDKLNGVDFSPCGRYVLTAGDDAIIRLHDLAADPEFDTNVGCRELSGHSGAVNAARFMADGRWILSGSRDRTLRLWSVQDGKCHRTIEGHVDAVTSLDVTRDARCGLSGSDDDTIRLWHLAWDYQFPGWSDWDDQANPLLQRFLRLRSKSIGPDGLDEQQFDRLMAELKYSGFGYLGREGVRRRLDSI